MSGGFEHSIRVPRLYKTVARIAQTVREDGASLKQLVYLRKHPNIKALYALALTTLQHGSQLDQLIRQTQILIKEPRLDPWLARVLITELLWGKQRLPSECKPVQTVLSYEQLLHDELSNTKGYDPPDKNKVQKPRYVRINTLSGSVEDAISSFRADGWRPLYRSEDYDSFIEALSNLSGMAFIQDIHVPELLAFPPRTQFYNHEAYTSGAIVLQDKASCLPAYLLNASPGSVVVDMCAAPGMKTTHLAAILQNHGKIYAVERDARRYETLCQIVQSTNSYCVETVNADVMTLDAKQCPDVEYILVDPSCSGSGMLDRIEIEGTNDKCAPGRLKNLQSFQIAILRHALLNFPSAKRVVYSTCSIYPEENEQVIDDVLSEVGDAYKVIPARKLLNDNWYNFSSTEYNCKDNCLYARPETDLSNGFFVAVLERDFSVPLPESKRKKKRNAAETNSNVEIVCNPSGESMKEASDADKKKRRKIMNQDHGNSEENNELINGNGISSNDSVEAHEENRVQDEMIIDKSVENDKNETDEVSSVKRKKTKKKKKDDDVPEEVTDNPDLQQEITESGRKKKKKCKRSHSQDEEQDTEELSEMGKSAKSKKKKKKRDKAERNCEEAGLAKDDGGDSLKTEAIEIADVQRVSHKMKKKKKQRKEII